MKRRMIVTLGLALAGCEGTETAGPIEATLLDVTCGPVVQGSLQAPADLAARLEVAEIGYALGDAAAPIRVEARGAGGAALGAVEITGEIDVVTLNGFSFTATLEGPDGATAARQTTAFRRVSPEETALTVTSAVGDAEAILWVTLDEDFMARRVDLGAPVPGAPGPGQIATLDGTYDVLNLLSETGTAAAQAEYDAFVAAHGLEPFEESVDFARLVALASGEGWVEPAEAHLRACEVERRAEVEARYAQRSQGLCGSPDSLEGLNAAGTLLGAFDTGMGAGFGMVENGALVGRSGLAAGAVFTGVGLGSVVVGGLIDQAVQNNKREVVGGASRLGSIVAGDGVGENEAFVDFFAGGDDGGGSGRSAGSHGDPHLDSVDGRAFDLQSQAEIVLVEATEGLPFEVQARQAPLSGGRCGNVAYNVAAAVRVGPHRVTVTAGEDPPLRVDGRPVVPPPSGLELGGVGFVRRGEGGYEIRAATGEGALVEPHGARLSLRVALPAHRRGQVRGALGRFDGDPDNDVSLPNGTALGPPVAWEDLHGPFTEAWRVDAETSLFDYPAGEGPDDYYDPAFPGRPASVDDVPAAERADAEAVCRDASVTDPVVLADCALDVYCSGDPGLADDHDGRDPEARLEVRTPVYLDGWSQTGDPGAGDWTVAEDGQAVSQSTNGDPTFFTSAREYFGRRITGRIRVDGGDDDYVGFVFGYRSPIDLADGSLTYRSWVLSWKGRAQGQAAEGLTLGYVDGDFTASELADVLWPAADAPGYTVVATRHGADWGWDRGEDFDFALEYGPDGVRVEIEGARVFDVPATQAPAGALAAGRFGFFNYSQPGVTYSGFRAGPIPARDASSCRALLDAGETADGVYDVATANGTVPVLCDMQTDGGGWTMVYKKSAGNAGDPYRQWIDGPLNDGDAALLDRAAAARDYRSRLVADWPRFDQVRVEVVDDGAVARTMTFDAAGTSSVSWFAPHRVVSSDWTDLPTDPEWEDGGGRFFSLDGSGPDSARRWYVNQQWGGCPNDQGWLLLSSASICGWEAQQDLPWAIHYSALDTVAQNDDPDEYRYADALIVFAR